MELNLKGKKAIVTGGSKGIGLAIKKALEKEGVKVISWSRETGQDLMKGVDLINYVDLLKADILINNVGGMGTCKREDAEDCMFKNYRLTQMLTDLYLQKNRNWGRVITIASIYGKEKGANQYFTAAKAAQIAYMKSMAGRYFGEITFNTICPGCINTKDSIAEHAYDNGLTLGEPEDVANIVTFLCSDKAKHINGAVITVDGGDSHSF